MKIVTCQTSKYEEKKIENIPFRSAGAASRRIIAYMSMLFDKSTKPSERPSTKLPDLMYSISLFTSNNKSIYQLSNYIFL